MKLSLLTAAVAAFGFIHLGILTTGRRNLVAEAFSLCGHNVRSRQRCLPPIHPTVVFSQTPQTFQRTTAGTSRRVNSIKYNTTARQFSPRANQFKAYNGTLREAKELLERLNRTPPQLLSSKNFSSITSVAEALITNHTVETAELMDALRHVIIRAIQARNVLKILRYCLGW